MNWLSAHLEWVIGVVLVPIVGILLKHWLGSSRKPATGATRFDASGSANAQILGDIHARDVHIGLSSPIPRTVASAPREPRRLFPNIECMGGETISLVDDGRGLVEKGSARNAIVIRFANDARPGVKNVGAPVKAALRYLDGPKEVCAFTGCWLEQHRDYANFRVDGRYTLVAGLVVNGDLAAPTKCEIHAHMRDYFLPDLKPLGNFRAGTLLVRLTNADSGDWLYEKQFKVNVNPLTITPS
jgi:hypothetical protein